MATTSTDLNSLPSLSSNIEVHEDRHPNRPQASSSSSSLSSPLLCNPCQDHGGTTPPFQIQQEGDDFVPHDGGSSWELSTTKHDSSTVLKFSFNPGKKEDHGDENQDREHSSVKWMSSKMRFMRRMMNSDPMNGAEKPTQVSQNHGDQNQRLSHSESLNNNSNNNDGINVRVCSDCNTTKTPLWRSGPRGPKSLCNACGIRQRKARRAMAAAAAAVENGTSSPTANLPSVKCKNKKRGKVGATAAAPSRSKKKLQFDDLAVSLSENSAFYHPQDEKEAAILLMALSCGLVHG